MGEVQEMELTLCCDGEGGSAKEKALDGAGRGLGGLKVEEALTAVEKL